MNISENKRIVGITALFAIAFGGLMYYGFDCAGKADESMAELDSIRDDYSGYEEASIQPTPENIKEIKKLGEEAKAKRKALEEMMDNFRKSCSGDAVSMSATDYLDRIKKDRAEIRKKAQEKGCSLADVAANFGKMDRDFETAPESVRVAPLYFQHRVINSLLRKMIDAGVTKVDNVFCRELPPATYSEGDDWDTELMSFEMDFYVPRGVCPSVLNDLMSNREFFITITGVYANNENALPEMDAFTPLPEPAEPDPNAEVPEGEAPAAVPTVAVLKTGSDAETVRIHLNFQVLYFNPKAH